MNLFSWRELDYSEERLGVEGLIRENCSGRRRVPGEVTDPAIAVLVLESLE
jgi:hypothetical protein